MKYKQLISGAFLLDPASLARQKEQATVAETLKSLG